MMPEKLITVEQYCGERFAAAVDDIERELAIRGVKPEEIDGQRYYNEREISLALTALCKSNESTIA